MIKRVNHTEIIERWKEFEEPIIKALTSSKGANITIGYSDSAVKNIYKKLTNPFNSSMQLWVAGANETKYTALTQLQKCEFTGKVSLVWFSITRIEDIEPSEVETIYKEGEKAFKDFAVKNKCEAIVGYTDLDYFAEKVKSDWPEAVTRYYFYLPISGN